MMNSRERFEETMAFGQPDRVPYFEEGIRKDVLEAWRHQGMGKVSTIHDQFPFDIREEIMPDLETKPYLRKWPNSISELDDLRDHLDPADSGRLPDRWLEGIRANRQQGGITMMRVHRGLFQSMGVAGWERFAELMVLLLDQPDLVHNVMEVQADFAVNLVDQVLQQTDIDAAVFSETIAGNDGPLISPKMYEEFALNHYEPVLKRLRHHGVKTIIIRTYANVRQLLPSIMNRDFDCLWACETNPQAMDYHDIRREFGRDLSLIGGIDTDLLREDQEIVRRKIEESVPLLLDGGGYIPLADGRIRADISYENYISYRRILTEVVSRSPSA